MHTLAYVEHEVLYIQNIDIDFLQQFKYIQLTLEQFYPDRKIEQKVKRFTINPETLIPNSTMKFLNNVY